MRTITRPTNMALALVGAAESAIVAAIKMGVDHSVAPHHPSVSWVARRVFDAPDHAGMITEPAVNAHLSKRTYDALHARGMV
jgi:hypothetical protein